MIKCIRCGTPTHNWYKLLKDGSRKECLRGYKHAISKTIGGSIKVTASPEFVAEIERDYTGEL